MKSLDFDGLKFTAIDYDLFWLIFADITITFLHSNNCFFCFFPSTSDFEVLLSLDKDICKGECLCKHQHQNLHLSELVTKPCNIF